MSHADMSLPERLAALQSRVAALEAERAVRRVFTRYMALCDVPAAVSDGESLGALFAGDASWEGVGTHYAQKFGRIEGRGPIVAMLGRYLPPTPHFSTNAHFVTSETIEIDSDAKHAKGRWLMLQASVYVGGGAELIGARLEIDFALAANGRDWQIARFRTERLFDAPWQANARATPGLPESFTTQESIR